MEGIQEINMLGKRIDRGKGEVEKEKERSDMELQREKMLSVSYIISLSMLQHYMFFSIHLLWNV